MFAVLLNPLLNVLCVVTVPWRERGEVSPGSGGPKPCQSRHLRERVSPWCRLPVFVLAEALFYTAPPTGWEMSVSVLLQK